MNNKICYAAIFKNESRNVYRCLDSLKSIIDYVCICDTGSTDNTIELIEKWGKENNIPTTVHSGQQQIFKNFGYNRTLSYRMAVKTYPDATYILLIDADMVVKITDKFLEEKNKLNLDQYMFEQVNPSIRYWNTRLISTKCKWKCVGVTHEYWDCKKKDSTKERTKLIWINDIGDGGSKENKFKRDIKLLTEGLKEETDKGICMRYKFYLANSYKDSGGYLDAINWYDERIKDGGYIEEVYMSYYYKGECYIKLADVPSAINSYLKAWDVLPERSETLYEVSKIYREQENNNLSFFFAKKGFEIKYPDPNKYGLFINYKIYEYLFLEELSIAGFYAGPEGRKLGKACLIKLLSMKDKINQKSYNIAMSNAKFYGVTEELIKKLTGN